MKNLELNYNCVLLKFVEEKNKDGMVNGVFVGNAEKKPFIKAKIVSIGKVEEKYQEFFESLKEIAVVSSDIQRIPLDDEHAIVFAGDILALTDEE